MARWRKGIRCRSFLVSIPEKSTFICMYIPDFYRFLIFVYL
jgi:hypothetical protein